MSRFFRHFCVILSVLFCCLPLFAADPQNKFSQRLEWKSDPNVFEYKVSVRNAAGKIDTHTTESNFIELSLPPGKYSYRVTAFDVLGKEAVSTTWTAFEILKAAKPVISNVKPVEVLKKDNSSLEMEFLVENVDEGSTVLLKNTATGKTVSGKLVIAEGAVATAAASESSVAKVAKFKSVQEGSWQLVVKNESGLTTESPAFTVHTIATETKIAEEARLAEERRIDEERRIAEEKRLEEERRIAEEKRIEEERRLAEEQRLAEERRVAEERRIAEEKRLEEERRIGCGRSSAGLSR